MAKSLPSLSHFSRSRKTIQRMKTNEIFPHLLLFNRLLSCCLPELPVDMDHLMSRSVVTHPSSEGALAEGAWRDITTSQSRCLYVVGLMLLCHSRVPAMKLALLFSTVVLACLLDSEAVGTRFWNQSGLHSISSTPLQVWYSGSALRSFSKTRIITLRVRIQLVLSTKKKHHNRRKYRKTLGRYFGIWTSKREFVH